MNLANLRNKNLLVCPATRSGNQQQKSKLVPSRMNRTAKLVCQEQIFVVTTSKT